MKEFKLYQVTGIAPTIEKGVYIITAAGHGEKIAYIYAGDIATGDWVTIDETDTARRVVIDINTGHVSLI